MATKKRKSDALDGKIASVGRAKKTKAGRQSAWNCFRRHEQERDDNIMEELCDVDDDEVKGELIQNALIGFAEYMIDNPVPQQNSTGKVLGDDGCKQYLSSVKEEIKDQTSSLPIWINHEEVWYTELRNRVGTGKKRDLITGAWEFKDPNSRALPIRCAASDLRQSERVWAELEGVDLESICKSMIAGDVTDCYRERAKLVLTALAVGRGGEVAFLRYDLFWWDDIYLCPEVIWARLKTTMQQPIYLQGCCDGYLCDIYHSMGSYFALEDGLFRLDLSNPRKNRLVFPDLRGVTTDTVASRMTTLIRAHSAPELRQRNQSRSIRVGSNTTLASHPDVLPEEQRNAGGFKSGYNTDLYTRMNPKLGMTAANALAGYKNARKMVYPPSLDSLAGLVDGNGLDRLMEKLYLISVPQFLPHGALRTFLQTATAKLIMEHPSMIADLGRDNKMVKKLVESMTKAKLAATPGEAAQRLDHWSNVIRKDYRTKNNLIPSATDATLLEVVQQQSVIINQLVLSNGNMERQMEKQTGEIASLRETVQSQSTSMVTALTTSLMGSLQTVWRVRSGNANNESTVSSVSSRLNKPPTDEPPAGEPPADEPTVDDSTMPMAPSSPFQQAAETSVNESSLPDLVTAFIGRIQNMIQDANNNGGKDKLAQLSWSEQQGASVKGVTVKETLLVLVNEKRLHTKKKLYDIEPASLLSKNRGHYWACMELVEQVVTQEQRLVLQLKPSEQGKIDDFDDVLKITAYTIENAAFKKMEELDGKKTSSMRPTISGLGNRYSKYCDNNKVERIKTSHKNLAAVPLTGSGSITSWFSNVKTNVVNVLSPGRKKQT
jgi:hypothetical protein